MDMENNGYYLPESCTEGEIYYIRGESALAINTYRPVFFLSYRPHPGELLIKENGVKRVIQRRILLAKKGNDTRDTTVMIVNGSD